MLRNGESTTGVAADRCCVRSRAVCRSRALCADVSILFWRLTKFIGNEGRMELFRRRTASAAGCGMCVSPPRAAGAYAVRRNEGRLQGGE
jgi:hypothetical protein